MADSSLPTTNGTEAGAPEPPGGESAEERSRVPGVARLHEEEQRVDGRFRWTLSSARPVCASCGRDWEPAEEVFTVLLPVSGGPEAGEPRDVVGVFERRELCAACFAKVRREETFAYWRTAPPEIREPVQKTINLESLFTHFERLMEPGKRESAGDGGFGDAVLQRYLLGLFLVRKRRLRWLNSEASRLVLECRRTSRRYEVEVPPLARDELARCVDEFAAIFH